MYFQISDMIDIQTFRARIGSAPGIMEKILQRKAARFKSRRNETHHEDEDLLRKFLKSVTISRRHQVYLLLVLLVIMFNITKCSVFRHSIHLTDYVCYVCRTSATKSIQYYHDHTCIQIMYEYTIMAADYMSSWTLIQERSDDFLTDITLTILCTGMCFSSVGAVHFISILLLMAGVESNPGPKGKKVAAQEDPKNTDRTSTALESSAPRQDVLAASAPLSQVPDSVYLETTACDTKAADVPSSSKKKGFIKLKSLPIKWKSKKRSNGDALGSSTTSLVGEDAEASSMRKTSVGFVPGEERVISNTRHSMTGVNIPSESAGRLLRRTQSLPCIPDPDVSRLVSSSKESDTATATQDISALTDDTDVLETTATKRELVTEETDQPEGSDNNKTILTLQNTNINKEFLEQHLGQTDPANDVVKVNFNHSTFSPLPWTDDLNDILDEHVRHPKLQAVTEWCLNSIGLSKVPSFWGKDQYHRLVDLDLSKNQLITLPNSFFLSGLKTLNLEGNPMFEIPALLAKFPCLRTLRVGSPQTRTIHRDLLTKVLKGKLIVEMDELQCGRYLRAPPYGLLKSAPEGLTVGERKSEKMGNFHLKTLEDYVNTFEVMKANVQGKIESSVFGWELTHSTCELDF